MSLIITMDDVGTRAQHLHDLHEIWTEGLAYMQNGHYLTVGDKVRIEELEHAIRLLTFHMRLGYSDTPYAKDINQIPEADKVEGGRGTNLKPPTANGESNYGID